MHPPRAQPRFATQGDKMHHLRRAITGLAAVAALLCTSPALCADAPNPKAAALARTLFAEMHMDRLMDGMLKSMMPAMLAQAKKANPALTDEQAQVVTDAVQEAMSGFMGKLVDHIVPLYAETFTEKELQDVVDFYGTPSGQAMLAKMPQMTAKMGPLMGELMPEMTADVNRRICSKIDCSKRGPMPAA